MVSKEFERGLMGAMIDDHTSSRSTYCDSLQRQEKASPYSEVAGNLRFVQGKRHGGVGGIVAGREIRRTVLACGPELMRGTCVASSSKIEDHSPQATGYQKAPYCIGYRSLSADPQGTPSPTLQGRFGLFLGLGRNV